MQSKNILSEATLADARAFGDNLRLARLSRNESVAKWAARAGCSASTIRRIEAGDTGVHFGVVLSILSLIGKERMLLSLANPENDIEGQRQIRARIKRPRRL